MIKEQGLLKAKTVGVDSTFLEANAAMKAITRKQENGAGLIVFSLRRVELYPRESQFWERLSEYCRPVT